MHRLHRLVLLSVLVLAPTLACAEPQWGRAPRTPGPSDRAYGYSRNGGYAFQSGLNDGYEAGLNDARGRRRYDPVGERRYRSADHGYSRRYGSRDAYKIDYREGFREGYDRGFNDGRRYDNRRRGGGFFEFRF
jgi:hypothetical protein